MVRFTLVGALIACVFTYGADAHGAMSFPATRNTVTSHFCPQCANGPGVCGASGGSQWPADATASEALNSAYTTPLTQLIAGGMIDVEVYFTATHQGHFVLELCQNPGPTITESCFVRLERDPGDTRYGPYASVAPDIAFLPTNLCAGQFNTPSNPLRMRYKVPSGATTSHGVLRWFWQTGNSCDTSPYNSASAPSSVTSWTNQLGSQTCKAVVTNMGISCGSNCPTASCNGEQFKNCADVSIVVGDPSTIVTSGNHHTDPGNGGSDGGNGGNGGGDGGNGGGNGGNGGGNGGNENWASELSVCQSTVKGVQPWWDADCLKYCSDALTDPFYAAFCEVRGITQLTPCVLALRTASCRQG